MVIGVINQLSYRLRAPNGLVVIWFLIWLVVDLPLWKIWKSVGMMKFPIYGKKKVPNHQPGFIIDQIYLYLLGVPAIFYCLLNGNQLFINQCETDINSSRFAAWEPNPYALCSSLAIQALKQVIRPFSPYTALSLKFTWLVVYLPSWNIWVRQWEGWHPIFMKWKIIQMFETTNQSHIFLMKSIISQTMLMFLGANMGLSENISRYCDV